MNQPGRLFFLSSRRAVSRYGFTRNTAAAMCKYSKFRAITATRSFHSGAPAPHDRLLVVGSGVAGSAAALIAAETHQIPVTLLYAGSLPDDCNSNWAQGGIIYRNYDPASGDSADLLADDIHRAGAGLCVDSAVRKVSEEGPARVRELLLSGGPFADVPFDKTPEGTLSLCLEASHAAPRILHYADRTGMLITQHITQAAMRHPLIKIQPNTLATDIVECDGICLGVSTLDRATGERSVEFASRGTVLASGGLAGIYEHSTNPAGFNALGSSVALANRAGVETRDLEYVQFHPTSLYMPNEARFLLTEALRGEGAVLRDASGRAFAKDFHPDGELAPRDIVARGVFEEGQKSTDGKHNVFLDITHRDADWLHARFPTIQAHLVERGLDLAKDQLPITPAAHYTCGGIATDLHGRTSMQGLYAAGEAARTGLHGGNRLASTSLLEGLVFGGAVADFVGSEEGYALNAQSQSILQGSEVKPHRVGASLEPHQIENAAHHAMQLLSQVRRIMWDNVGVVRTPQGLATARASLGEIYEEASDLHRISPTLETTALRDAVCAGQAVAAAAAANSKSGGAHYMVADAYEEIEEEVGTVEAVAVR
eukprot:Nitzschia sp. Nitz4//scaffold19_size178191//75409//77296//NITZ4_001974-RA/size178191-processed-gene-0.61-mRNA-1//-1//CDS//3329540670//1992//frame0